MCWKVHTYMQHECSDAYNSNNKPEHNTIHTVCSGHESSWVMEVLEGCECPRWHLLSVAQFVFQSWRMKRHCIWAIGVNTGNLFRMGCCRNYDFEVINYLILSTEDVEILYLTKRGPRPELPDPAETIQKNVVILSDWSTVQWIKDRRIWESQQWNCWLL